MQEVLEIDLQKESASRKKANLAILKILTKMANEFPDWRFHQLLMNLNIEDSNDRFSEESSITLTKLIRHQLVSICCKEK